MDRLIGPWVTGGAVARHGLALGVVTLVALARWALVPVLGIESPLLPFVAAVLVATVLSGPVAGVLAAAAAPLLAAVIFTSWPADGSAFPWVGHTGLFLLSATVTALLMGGMQRSFARQTTALRVALAAEKKRAASERQLQLLTDNLPALIGFIDGDGYYQFANAAYAEWTGRPAPYPVGAHVREVLGADEYANRKTQMDRALSGELVTFDAPLPDGSGRQLAITYVPEWIDGKVAGFFVMGLDVTERQRAVEALQEADTRKDEFLSMMAHELRNPLAPIRNVATLLQRRGIDALTVQRSGEMLQRQVTQLSRMVDDLLDVARLARGRIGLTKESLSLVTALDAAVDALQPQMAARQQPLQRDRASEEVWLSADPVRLTQVFMNLLSNASTYSDHHTAIRIEVEVEALSVLVRIVDQGRGIDADLLPQLFTSLVQGQRSLDRSEGGLGLGLSIVRSLVELHDGAVGAQSDGPGRGSLFWVRLPRHMAAAQATPEPDRARGPGSRRVLVVDDNSDAADSLRLLLEQMGHQATVALDGTTALSMLKDFKPDTVVLDIGLPAMDGYAVAHAMRGQPGGSTLRIFALSGYGRAADRQRALESGFDDYFVKPADSMTLDRILR